MNENNAMNKGMGIVGKGDHDSADTEQTIESKL